jgi:hypothetical protein
LIIDDFVDVKNSSFDGDEKQMCLEMQKCDFGGKMNLADELARGVVEEEDLIVGSVG